ncbi:MAG: DUF5684 domain-containing protein [Bryobacteraceae bacterium]
MTMIPAMLLQEETSGSGFGALLASGIVTILFLAIAVVFAIGIWKVFVKAGQPGWAALIPFYNIYILLKIVGRPAWWLVLFLIPLVNLVILLLVAIDLAKAFGQSAVFGVVLLFLLGGIGYLVLGFGNYKYAAPATAVA